MIAIDTPPPFCHQSRNMSNPTDTLRQPSAFATWFEAQQGKRPKMHGVDDRDLAGTIEAGHRAQAVLNAQRLYDARRQLALYAWQAKR
jgi:hypothetical protein